MKGSGFQYDLNNLSLKCYGGTDVILEGDTVEMFVDTGTIYLNASSGNLSWRSGNEEILTADKGYIRLVLNLNAFEYN